MSPDDPTYWLGRHKKCGRKLRVKAMRVWKGAFVAAYDFGPELTGFGRPLGVRDTGMLVAGRGGHWMVAIDCTCGGTFWLRQVHGIYDKDKPCSPRCQAATGPSCECACAGANHGARHG